MTTILEQILDRSRARLLADKQRTPQKNLEHQCRDMPPTLGFAAALRGSFGLIAEVKARSPSKGRAIPENMERAPEVYEQSPIVKALSVLTERDYFGMSIHKFKEIREQVTKPMLRKDFIYDDYQVYEARAAGADAILLMMQVLRRGELQELHELAVRLGMDVLVECREPEDFERLPKGIKVVGINSREFNSVGKRYWWTRLAKQAGIEKDFSTNLSSFSLVKKMPRGVIKVAESGLTASTVHQVMEAGFNAALVGNALLNHRAGVMDAVNKFATAVKRHQSLAETETVGKPLHVRTVRP